MSGQIRVWIMVLRLVETSVWGCAMPDVTFNIFRITDIGGTDGLEMAGSVTVRDDNGFRDDIFDDIEQAPNSETNGDQEVISSSVSELDVGDTIRTRGIFRFTNNDTGETYDVTEVFSGTAGNPTEQLFIFTSTAPDWIFDDTDRSFALLDSDGTLPYSSIVCFGAGTLIGLGGGRAAAVETLKVGDRVLIREGGMEPIRWIGSHRVTPYGLYAHPQLRPVRIMTGALGANLPERDLIVSPQHRVLIRSKIAARIFGSPEVLIPAKKLLGLDGIAVAEDLPDVTYFHILFDQHRLIYSNGALTESLFTGPQAMASIQPEARAEIEALFPHICVPGFAPAPAGVIPQRGRQVEALIARHVKNRKALFEAV